MEGTISYVGFLSSCVKTPDAILVKILRDAGAGKSKRSGRGGS